MGRKGTLRRSAHWVGLVLLAWNGIGIAAFIGQATQDLTALARQDAYQAELFATMPLWAWIAYGVAVFSGLIGSGALLLRHRLAVPLFTLSLIGVIVQFGRTFLMTDLIEVRGAWTAIFPAFIAAVALFQLWFAMKLGREGQLS